MSTVTPGPKVKQHPMAKLLDENAISDIAIIDDAYNQPEKEDFTRDQITSFLGQISDDEDAKKEWIDNKITQHAADDFENIDDIDTVAIQHLWLYSQKDGKLSQICKQKLFDKIIEKQAQIAILYEFLSEDLKRKAIKFGTTYRVEDLENCKIVFIDYILGSGETLEEAVEPSIEIAKELFEKYKPLIVLMSRSKVDLEMQEKFRSASKLMGGMFYFLSKADMARKDKLSLELYPIAKSIKTSYAINNFSSTLKTHIESAADELVGQVRKLSVSDYAYLQKLSLAEEQHPLGDYMLWLCGEYFNKILTEKIREERVSLNALTINDLPPHQFGPSLSLTEIYQGALFDYSSNDAHLRLGDIYIKENKVLMIINAQCDLVRDVDDDLTIVFLEGELFKHAEADPKEKRNARTELIEINQNGTRETYKIVWYLNQVETIRFADKAKIENEMGFKKILRLKTPFAIQLQNAYSANLARVGVPVAPPINSSAHIEVFCEGVDGKAERLLPLFKDAAILYYLKKDDKCKLNTAFIEKLLDTMVQALSCFDNNIKYYTGISGTVKEVEKKIANLKQKQSVLKRLVSSEAERFKLLEPISVPKVGGFKKFQNLFYITHDMLDASELHYPSNDQPIWLNIVSH